MQLPYRGMPISEFIPHQIRAISKSDSQSLVCNIIRSISPLTPCNYLIEECMPISEFIPHQIRAISKSI